MLLLRIEETGQLEKEIAEMQEILGDRKKVRALIISDLKEVSKKYGKPRRSLLYYPTEEDEQPVAAEMPDYPVHLFFTREGYFKKITPQSLRMSSEHKLKEGDSVVQALEGSNNMELLFFTDRAQVYKAKASDFDDTKASVMGDYIPARLGMEEGENAVYLAATSDFAGYMLFFFENGKVAKVELSGYQTKTNRKKLLGAFWNLFFVFV